MEIKVHKFRKGYNLALGQGTKKPNTKYKSVKKLLKSFRKGVLADYGWTLIVRDKKLQKDAVKSFLRSPLRLVTFYLEKTPENKRRFFALFGRYLSFCVTLEEITVSWFSPLNILKTLQRITSSTNLPNPMIRVTNQGWLFEAEEGFQETAYLLRKGMEKGAIKPYPYIGFDCKWFRTCVKTLHWY